MKYEKLKQICRKKKRYTIIGLCCFFPAFVLALVCVIARLCYEERNDTLLAFCLIAGIVTIVVSIVVGRLEAKWHRRATDYVVIKIMDTINEYGIDSSKFELIQETPLIYRVGFHNQIIDYKKLQAKLDAEIAAMNKITGDSIRVELI